MRCHDTWIVIDERMKWAEFFTVKSRILEYCDIEIIMRVDGYENLLNTQIIKIPRAALLLYRLRVEYFLKMLEQRWLWEVAFFFQ